MGSLDITKANVITETRPSSMENSACYSKRLSLSLSLSLSVFLSRLTHPDHSARPNLCPDLSK